MKHRSLLGLLAVLQANEQMVVQAHATLRKLGFPEDVRVQITKQPIASLVPKTIMDGREEVAFLANGLDATLIQACKRDPRTYQLVRIGTINVETNSRDFAAAIESILDSLDLRTASGQPKRFWEEENRDLSTTFTMTLSQTQVSALSSAL